MAQPKVGERACQSRCEGFCWVHTGEVTADYAIRTPTASRAAKTS